MAKFLTSRIKKLESFRKTQNDNTRWLERFREQNLKALKKAMEKEGIRPIDREDFTNNGENGMDLKRLLQTIKRAKEGREQKR